LPATQREHCGREGWRRMWRPLRGGTDRMKDPVWDSYVACMTSGELNPRLAASANFRTPDIELDVKIQSLSVFEIDTRSDCR